MKIFKWDEINGQDQEVKILQREKSLAMLMRKAPEQDLLIRMKNQTLQMKHPQKRLKL